MKTLSLSLVGREAASNIYLNCHPRLQLSRTFAYRKNSRLDYTAVTGKEHDCYRLTVVAINVENINLQKKTCFFSFS